MRRGFVTFVNNNQKYRDLHDCLVESLIEFTDLEIEVFGLNFDYQSSNKRVLPKRIDIQPENFWSICYTKIFAALNSEFDVTMHIDSDAVAAPGVLKVFEEFDPSNRFIVASKHPWNGPLNSHHFDAMRFVGAEKQTQPYVHAATFIFSKNAKWFLQEVADYAEKSLREGFYPINQDETLINCLLWKHKQEDCFIDCYDPDPTYFKSLTGITSEVLPEIPNLKKINPYICHGQKEPSESREIFEQIRKKMGH